MQFLIESTGVTDGGTIGGSSETRKGGKETTETKLVEKQGGTSREMWMPSCSWNISCPGPDAGSSAKICVVK